jgi:hypothetical protein
MGSREASYGGYTAAYSANRNRGFLAGGLAGIVVGVAVFYFCPDPWKAWAYLAVFTGAALVQRTTWLTVLSLARRSRMEGSHRPTVHFLETLREYVANESAEQCEVAEPAGGGGVR